MISENIAGILEKYGKGHGGLIAILEEIQSLWCSHFLQFFQPAASRPSLGIGVPGYRLSRSWRPDRGGRTEVSVGNRGGRNDP